MSYVDGFVLAVRKDRLAEYEARARVTDALWKKHGALAVVECVGDDVPFGTLTSFPRAVQAAEDEVVIFSWIIYESRAHRDEVNAKVFADPDLSHDMPFDGQRMIYGGFRMLFSL